MTALRHFCAPTAGELKVNAEINAGRARREFCKEVFQEMMMTLSRRWVRGAVWVVLLVAGSVFARAQEVSGSISGTVMNAKGAAVSGAVVTLTNTDRAYVERTLKTNKAGYYTAGSLPLGNYSVGIAMREFKTVSIT